MKFFQGTYTAIITPFKEGGELDVESFDRIIEYQIQAGVDGIVVLGTTGESPTLSAEEHDYLVAHAVKAIDGRTKVIAGTGSNSTQEAIDRSVHAENVGADALLQVSPYYNKPTQQGLIEHFEAIANHVHIPILLYNIKGRCGINIETPTLLRLAEHKNIQGVKEASGDIQQMMDVIRKTPDDFSVMSGDDNMILPFMFCGGDGVVSVLSNAMPRTLSQLIQSCLNREAVKAQEIFYDILDIMRTCFIETNPIPIKEMMSMLGYGGPNFRLPMCRASEENRKKIAEAVERIKAIEKV